MSNNNEPPKQSTKDKAILLIMAGTIAVIFAPYLLTRSSSFPSFSSSTGAIGDTIGGITAPIVGMLGAILVFYALLEQIKANKIISDQFLEQKKITHRQNFEQTFFSMLNIHHETVNNIEYDRFSFSNPIERKMSEIGKIEDTLKVKIDSFNRCYNSGIDNSEFFKGRDFFRFSLNALKESICIADNIGGLRSDSKSFEFTNPKTGETLHSYFYEEYEKNFHQLDTHLGHYYRNLYRIIKMIDQQKFSEDEKEDYEAKYFYTSIVRSQLSDYEIQWLFFNGLFHYGNKKFKPLIQEYTLLKILTGNPEKTITKFKFLYAETAFKKISWEEAGETKTEKKNYRRKQGHERTVVG